MDCKYKLPCGWCDKFDKQCGSTPAILNNNPYESIHHILKLNYYHTCSDSTTAVLGGCNNSVTTAVNEKIGG